MATTMTIAETTVTVGLPPEEAHKKWLEWTSKGGPGMPRGGSEEVKTGQLPTELQNAESGTSYFEPGPSNGTSVRMQLRYNRDAVEKEGLGPNWVEQRINLYLTRFKNCAEGRPA